MLSPDTVASIAFAERAIDAIEKHLHSLGTVGEPLRNVVSVRSLLHKLRADLSMPDDPPELKLLGVDVLRFRVITMQSMKLTATISMKEDTIDLIFKRAGSNVAERASWTHHEALEVIGIRTLTQAMLNRMGIPPGEELYFDPLLSALTRLLAR